MSDDRLDGMDVSGGENVGLGSSSVDVHEEGDEHDDPAAKALDSMGYAVDDEPAVERPSGDSGGSWLATVRYLLPLVVAVVVLLSLVAVWLV